MITQKRTRDYRNIKAYQFADDLVVEVYRMTKAFPKEERYGLTSQLRRAATSVPTNIAEGASRQHKRDYLHFLYISRGSMAETEYLLHLSNRLQYLTQEEYERLKPQSQEVAKTLYGLIMSVEKEAGFVSRTSAVITSAFTLFALRMFVYV